jgi:hypothetical protein
VLFNVIKIIIPSILVAIGLRFFGFLSNKEILVLTALFLVFSIRFGWSKSLTSSVSFFITVILTSLIVNLSGLVDKSFYRPFEKLLNYVVDCDCLLFRKTLDFEMKQPHGDLYAIDPGGLFEVEPRNIKTTIDSLGFRNNFDYKGEKFLLVGDSFVLGIGNTQNHILSNQLKDKFGISTYSLAQSGNLFSYVKFIKYFKKSQKVKEMPKVILFLFEGNDFRNYDFKTFRESEKSYSLRRIKKIYRKVFVERPFFYFTYSLYSNAYRSVISRFNSNDSQVKKGPTVTLQVKDNNVGFLGEYIDQTVKKKYPSFNLVEKELEFMRNKIRLIVFIPTKYRVYHELIENPPHKSIPNKNWEYLDMFCEKLDIKLINLTEPLINRAKLLLKGKNQLVWWKDDTHWNDKGIAVTAEEIHKNLKIDSVKFLSDSKIK